MRGSPRKYYERRRLSWKVISKGWSRSNCELFDMMERDGEWSVTIRFAPLFGFPSIQRNAFKTEKEARAYIERLRQQFFNMFCVGVPNAR